MSPNEPPQFGPNGRVLSSPGHPDELRADDLVGAKGGELLRSSKWNVRKSALSIAAIVLALLTIVLLPESVIARYGAAALLLVITAQWLPVPRLVAVGLIALPLVGLSILVERQFGWEFNHLCIAAIATICLSSWLLPKLGIERRQR